MSLDHRWLLAPGAHVVPEEGGLLLISPSEEIARVQLPAGDHDLLRAVLAGRLTPARALASADDRALLHDVLEGCLAEQIAGPALTPAAEGAEKVTVTGDNPIAAALTPILTAAGFAVITAAEDADTDTDLLVACAGWLPDRRWQQLDQVRLAANRPWHRCHLEGVRVVVGPFSATDSPSYTDTRTRRLAASSWPDELEALWAHLDTTVDLAPPPWPDPGVCALAAGLIAADLIAYRSRRRPAGADRQVVIDPSTLRWQEHPVLPVPTGLMVDR